MGSLRDGRPWDSLPRQRMRITGRSSDLGAHTPGVTCRTPAVGIGLLESRRYMRRKHSLSTLQGVLVMSTLDSIELIDREETCHELGKISTATLYRGVASGRFPRPINVGPNTVRWVLAEIRACKIAMMNSRAAS
jgi:predicted DNA-binding transcriptional regulator AlpA